MMSSETKKSQRTSQTFNRTQLRIHQPAQCFQINSKKYSSDYHCPVSDSSKKPNVQETSLILCKQLESKWLMSFTSEDVER